MIVHYVPIYLITVQEEKKIKYIFLFFEQTKNKFWVLGCSLKRKHLYVYSSKKMSRLS